MTLQIEPRCLLLNSDQEEALFWPGNKVVVGPFGSGKSIIAFLEIQNFLEYKDSNWIAYYIVYGHVSAPDLFHPSTSSGNATVQPPSSGSQYGFQQGPLLYQPPLPPQGATTHLTQSCLPPIPIAGVLQKAHHDDVNARDSVHGTALYVAAYHGHVQVAEVLLFISYRILSAKPLSTKQIFSRGANVQWQ